MHNASGGKKIGKENAYSNPDLFAFFLLLLFHVKKIEDSLFDAFDRLPSSAVLQFPIKYIHLFL